MIGHYVADTVEANFSSVFLNVIERDDLSNEGASQNEGAPNEGAQVSEGDAEHPPIIGGIFRYSEGDGPPRRVRVLEESKNNDGE